jgi:medium-chain acyl-[acyl-carrier-protein] hydrolase
MLPTYLFISSRRAPHLPDPHQPISSLSGDAFAQAIQKRYKGIPKIIQQDPDLMNIFLPILRADFSVLETYQYVQEPSFEFPIFIYFGLQDITLTMQDVIAWQVHTHLPLVVETFPGDHFFIQSQRLPVLVSLSKAIEKYIEGGG